LTHGYELAANYIIHTVGPVWRGGEHQEEEILRNCYRNSLALAEIQGFQSIAFPNIATGAYCFPAHRAAEIAIEVAQEHIAREVYLKNIYFVCFEENNYDIYRELLNVGEDNDG